MSDAYRQKLLNWFCTMLLLLLVCALSLCLGWRIILTNAELAGGDWPLDAFAGFLGEAFRPYFMFFPLLAIWHMFDFLEADSNPPRRKGWFADYRSFLILLMVASPFAILSVVDGHILSSCYRSMDIGETGFYDSCYPSSTWTILLWLVIAPAVCLAVVSKSVTAVRSRLSVRA